MDRLFAKIGTPSYFPKPSEVIEGVKWLRENPAVAAGVVVGLTSYSVAKYYDYVDADLAAAGMLEQDDNGDSVEVALETRVTKEEIARSISVIQLGLLKMHVNEGESFDGLSAANSSASTVSSSGGMRSRASTVFTSIHEEPLPHDTAATAEATCCHGADEDTQKQCCDPDWGWFVPTSPRRP